MRFHGSGSLLGVAAAVVVALVLWGAALTGVAAPLDEVVTLAESAPAMPAADGAPPLVALAGVAPCECSCAAAGRPRR